MDGEVPPVWPYVTTFPLASIRGLCPLPVASDVWQYGLKAQYFSLSLEVSLHSQFAPACSV